MESEISSLVSPKEAEEFLDKELPKAAAAPQKQVAKKKGDEDFDLID